MGTWIEMKLKNINWKALMSFPAMGTWIEINLVSKRIHQIQRRSLQWERGLKYRYPDYETRFRHVVPCNGNVD